MPKCQVIQVPLLRDSLRKQSPWFEFGKWYWRSDAPILSLTGLLLRWRSWVVGPEKIIILPSYGEYDLRWVHRIYEVECLEFCLSVCATWWGLLLRNRDSSIFLWLDWNFQEWLDCLLQLMSVYPITDILTEYGTGKVPTVLKAMDGSTHLSCVSRKSKAQASFLVPKIDCCLEQFNLIKIKKSIMWNSLLYWDIFRGKTSMHWEICDGLVVIRRENVPTWFMSCCSFPFSCHSSCSSTQFLLPLPFFLFVFNQRSYLDDNWVAPGQVFFCAAHYSVGDGAEKTYLNLFEGTENALKSLNFFQSFSNKQETAFYLWVYEPCSHFKKRYSLFSSICSLCS